MYIFVKLSTFYVFSHLVLQYFLKKSQSFEGRKEKKEEGRKVVGTEGRMEGGKTGRLNLNPVSILFDQLKHD